jgi:lipoprotein NlpI
MRRVLAAVAFVAASAAAWAAGYDDFVRAGELRRVGNVDGALAAYSAALSAGDLAPAYMPDAYHSRAELYYRTGKCASALADLDAALKLRPAMIEALRLRARANDCLGNMDAARADLDAVIAAAPASDLYASRGSFNWFHGKFVEAAEDYGTAASLHNKRSFDWRPGAYSLAWYAIAASRAQRFIAADFAAKAKGFDLDPWPGPLVSFFLGKTTQDAVYREAAKGEGDLPKAQKCEADFFLAEWQFASGNAAAKALLQTVPDNCPKPSVVVAAAKADLRRIP